MYVCARIYHLFVVVVGVVVVVVVVCVCVCVHEYTCIFTQTNIIFFSFQDRCIESGVQKSTSG